MRLLRMHLPTVNTHSWNIYEFSTQRNMRGGLMRSLTEYTHKERCECGAFLPLSWDWDEVEEEDENRRYMRVVFYVQCVKCGLMHEEEA
jgi:hypothetical protein